MRYPAAFLAVILLVGCGAPPKTPEPTLMPTRSPQPTVTSIPTPEPTSELSYIKTLPPTEPLVQLVRTNVLPIMQRFPTWVLYPDGRLIYQIDDLLLWERHLDAPDVEALMQSLLALGIEDLRGYHRDEVCTTQIEGAPCITDQYTAFLTVRLDADRVFTLEAYNNYTSDPDTYVALRNILYDYQVAEGAELYYPEVATICYETWGSTEDVPLWALESDMPLQENSGKTQLNEAQSARVIDAAGRNFGIIDVQSGGRHYIVTFVPHLPSDRAETLNLPHTCDRLQQ